jgi:tetratricopeptide (TPR) repeat protein
VRRAPRWPYWLAALAATVVAFWAYGPALHGTFMFDDAVLPFALPSAAAPFMEWMRGSASRPLLYVTYWFNSRLSGDDTFSYHVLNVIFHLVASGLVFLIVRRFVEWSQPESAPQRRNLLAGLAASIFLLHPVQTEAVAYLAGRSDSLSVMLFLAAFAAFLYRPRREISWGMAAAVLILFGAALLSKQHTIVLPALLLLTDYWWNPGFSLQGMRANWRLYAVMALGALGGLAEFWQVLMTSTSAGFSLKAFTWYQYFFTQCRALFVYIGQFLLPVHLDVDWDFPISRNIFDHGAIVGLAALVALVLLAWHFRRRFPLATYGFLAYLVLMAPTSSILPINDPIADRRLYLSMLGLLLIVVDGVSRLRVRPKELATALGLVLLAAAWATRAHAAVWADPVALWQDTVQKSPNKGRVHFQLAFAYRDAGHCDLAVREYQKTADLEPSDYGLLVDWALAYDCLNQTDQAVAKLRQAAALKPTAHVYSQIGMVYAKQARWAEAMTALDVAQKIDPNYGMTYYYKGGVHLSQNQVPEAVADYRRAIQLDGTYQPALDGLANAEARLRAIERIHP